MKNKKQLVLDWFEKADKDCLTAERELSFKDPVTESVCFHCQQAVEKYLKGYMVYLDIDVKHTHEIGDLISSISEKDKEISKFIEEADTLTDYAVEVRYPDDYFEPSVSDAKNAYNITTLIKNHIKSKTES